MIRSRPWLQDRYRLLLAKYHQRTFTFREALDYLRAMVHDSPNLLRVALCQLRKAGVLETRKDPKDTRMKLYQLKPIKELPSSKPSRSALNARDYEALWLKAEEMLRPKRGSKFLPLLLLIQRFSGLTNLELMANLNKPSPGGFIERLKILAQCEPEINEAFEVESFIKFEKRDGNAKKLRRVIELLNMLPMNQANPEVISEAFERFLRRFAPPTGKAGVYYPPPKLLHLLVEVVEPQSGETIFAPFMCLGSLLIHTHHHLEQNKIRKGVSLYGQEAEPIVLAQARMNLLFNDITNAQVLPGDAMLCPGFRKGDKLQTFDVVLTIPSLRLDHDHERLLRKEANRQKNPYGFLPHQPGDWAVVQNLLSFAKEHGRVGVILSGGSLSRGGKERTTREEVVMGDFLEAIIHLPPKITGETAIPGAILVFNKGKTPQRKGRVLFIAPQENEHHPKTRRSTHFQDSEIEKIVKTFHAYQELEGFSRAVSINEIKDNNFNLTPTSYVISKEDGVPVDVSSAWKTLKDQDSTLRKVTDQIEGTLRKLGYF